MNSIHRQQDPKERGESAHGLGACEDDEGGESAPIFLAAIEAVTDNLEHLNAMGDRLEAVAGAFCICVKCKGSKRSAVVEWCGEWRRIWIARECQRSCGISSRRLFRTGPTP